MWWLIFQQMESPVKSKKRDLILLRKRLQSCHSGNNTMDNKALATVVKAVQARRIAGLATVVTLGAMAPLLGLLGTITGMIATFETVSDFGLGNARAMAEGISEAMITTRTGLIIAIPGLLVAYFMKRKLTRHRRFLKQAGLEMMHKDNDYEL
jgi:biopolymer transport protein ExbB